MSMISAVCLLLSATIRCFDYEIIPDEENEQFQPIRISLPAVSVDVAALYSPATMVGTRHTYFIFRKVRYGAAVESYHPA